jgi:RNA polymerase sigma factor (sigma-70 family)
LGTPLLRLRSDQQLVTLFREGNEEAFSVIHDRYRPRLRAYVRQMLPGRAGDVDDVLQDVFVRAYAGLRTSDQELALRPWLYRVAHNRCIDELRRPILLPEPLEAHNRISHCDPAAETEQRESLRRLVADIHRLPDQQRSALLMRELSGMAYAEVAGVLGISVPAVKSLLVRARIGLAQATEARDAACVDIRRELAEAHEDGVRASWMARRHLRDCAGCRACRAEMRSQRRQVAALAPTFGPLALLAKLFGIGSGAGGGTATAASAGGATAAGAGGTATAATGLATIAVGHVATILAAAVVTAGGAVAVQQTVASPGSHHARHALRAAPAQSAATAAESRMRVPALIPAATPRHAQAAPVRHTLPAAPRSTAATRWHGPPLPAATPGDHPAQAVPTSADATSTTCTPPPPPVACTASQTTTCSSGSGTGSSTGSTSSSGTQSTTTAQTTPSGQSATTAQTTPTPGSNSTGTGTTSGSTSGTTAASTSSAAGGTTASSCSATTQPTSTQAAGSGQTGTGSTGSGSTGSGSTGSGSTGSGESGKSV